MMFRFYELREGLRIALTAIRANKMRSVLTTLGIVIGIVTVTMMATVIEGLHRSLNKSIEALGSDVFYVSKWDWFTDNFWKSRNRKEITLKQAYLLRDRLTLAKAVAPVARTFMKTFRYSNRSLKGNVQGTTSDFILTSGVVPKDGRFFNAIESENARHVCVIGSTVAEELFPRIDPIGKVVKIDGNPFRVVGVLEEEGDFLGSSFWSSDSQIFLPIEVFLQIFGDNRSIDINVKIGENVNKEDARLEIIGAFRQIRRVPSYKENDFGINEQEFLRNIFDQIVGVIGVIGFVITSLSLLVGSIGIMNIMFVSVKERTKEIGTRKAIGAKRRTIMIQFLIEASAICLMGGLIGLAIAIPGSLIIDKFLPTAMPLWVVGLAIGLSLLVGLISGSLPAYTAAKMDPVDALRYE